MASEERQIVLTDGQSVALRRSARARRMILRVPRDGSGPVLTLPSHVPISEGRAFAESRAAWLAGACDRVPAPQVVAPGALLPVEGRPLLLVPRDRPAGAAVARLLRHLAMTRLHAATDRHAAALGRAPAGIVLRDTRSRWGSCTAAGRIMYSWRLAMAPPAILDYVAAHEVAHLRHMDHSPRFWATVAELLPDHAERRAWLRLHGPALMQWRFRD